MSKEKKCGKGHKGHLCVLAKKKKYKHIMKLSKKPGFICKKCLRVADCEKNLCQPMPFG